MATFKSSYPGNNHTISSYPSYRHILSSYPAYRSPHPIIISSLSLPPHPITTITKKRKSPIPPHMNQLKLHTKPPSCLSFPRILLPSCLSFPQILLPPCLHIFHYRHKAFPKFSQGILYFRRDFFIIMPVDKSISLKFTQLCCQ